ncbi:2OG-Fe(II) oxygenase [Sphingomonas oryzagri]|uniref:2OG-Fe(II) oxygenase n=1 Tax=Sphingomonas oryzagri TaxID=3042314 RepID=A0ABT6N091_9SPHN|nr:2OG-Fe(II) oxygenase [Sphingomonas oryzagri]MDH7638486.1 2OG-Fe(II) oxygenase [Sphingomonas oryzagri]
MAYLDGIDPRTGFIPLTGFEHKGKELAGSYTSAKPFPSIAIDDFLPDELINGLFERFCEKRKSSDLNHHYNRYQEKLKDSYNPDTLDDFARAIFYSFNSRSFVKIFENITGLKGLIPDPYFFGAGFHEMHNGGSLAIHTDFNHHKILNLERRITVLIYLNKDWKSEYGGQLELWDAQMTHAVRSFEPSFNRCVIFTTSNNSLHGNPNPINHPDGLSRKSIALYYYTSTWDKSKRSHTTQFKVRPGSRDRTDWSIKKQELIEDLFPPIILRKVTKFKQLIRNTLG